MAYRRAGYGGTTTGNEPSAWGINSMIPFELQDCMPSHRLLGLDHIIFPFTNSFYQW